MGNPARRKGWMSRHGHALTPQPDGAMTCPESGLRYAKDAEGRVRCLDLDEESPLPAHLAKGTRAYDTFKVCQ